MFAFKQNEAFTVSNPEKKNRWNCALFINNKAQDKTGTSFKNMSLNQE